MGINDRWDARTAAELGARVVFRPRIALVTAVLWAALLLTWLVTVLTSAPGSLLVQVPLMALLTAAVHVTCIRPVVAIREHDVVLRNVLRDVTVPWSHLRDVDTQYALTLTTSELGRDGTERRFRAWAAPAPSRFSAARATPSDIRSINWDRDELPPPASAHLRADSGAAAIMVRRAWDAAGPVPAGSTVQVRWATPWPAVLALSAVATAVTLLWW